MLSTKLKEAAGNSADATLYVDDVFSTYLYTGTGSTQTITNGIDLAGKGGLVWTKKRSPAEMHMLTDTVRGAGNTLVSNLVDANEYDISRLSAFTSSGFSVGTSAGINESTKNFVSWTFREAAKFFDVVTYTGTGSARTIAHSLGIAPGMVIVKRTDTTGNWQVYSNGLTSAAYSIQLNSVNPEASAPTVWNSTAPTSSVFSVGTDSSVNNSGSTYVAYLFAHDTSSTGIIQCGGGTFDSNGGTSVTLGYEPQWVLFKESGGGANWFIFDNMRGFNATPSTSSRYLVANSNGVENNFGLVFAPNATGFTVGNAFDPNVTYIYMAIRMPNKPPTSGTQVFSPTSTATASSPGATATTNFPVDLSIYALRNLAGLNSIFFDRLRGTNSTSSVSLATSSSAAEVSSGSNGIGIQSNTTVTENWTGGTGYTNILWNFKRAPGFFDEVCYTGTGSATTQAHNLGVAPELMITKNRSSAGFTAWLTCVPSIGMNNILSLNTSGAIDTGWSSPFTSTSPTSSVFSLSSGQQRNETGVTYVAYLFATLAGISKVGSYTGNGTGQVIACGFSTGARFVLIKRTDDAGNWYTFDSARGLTVGSSPYLLLNSTAAEVTGNNGVYASTGGFTLGATAITTTNIATATYIFLAVA